MMHGQKNIKLGKYK